MKIILSFFYFISIIYYEKYRRKTDEKNNKAITLIALVITIIVLLILAGVTIATLTGENGILNRAKAAKNVYSQEDAREGLILKISEVKTKIWQEKNRDATLNDALSELENDSEIEITELMTNGTANIASGINPLETITEKSYMNLIYKEYQFTINYQLIIISINGIEINAEDENNTESKPIDYWTLNNTSENSAEGVNSGSLLMSSGEPRYEDGGVRLNDDRYSGPYAGLENEYTLTENYTIALQTKQTEYPTYDANSIFSIYSGETDISKIMIFVIYDSENKKILYGTNTNYQSTDYELSLNEWHTFVVTNDGTYITYFVDGIQYAQIDSFNAKSGKLTLGGSRNVQKLNGASMLYKNLAIYHRVAGFDEITELLAQN